MRFLLLIIFLLTNIVIQAQDVVRFQVREYPTGNESYMPFQILITNLESNQVEGTVKITSRQMVKNYKIKLEANETLVIEEQIYSSFGHIELSFKKQTEIFSLNSRYDKPHEFAALIVKDPSRMTPRFFLNERLKDKLENTCCVSEIEINELPLRYFSYLSHQLVILPFSLESKMSVEQANALKEYVSFGGQLVFLGDEDALPKKWQDIQKNSFGNISLIDYANSINIKPYLKANVSPLQYFTSIQNDFTSFLKHNKGIYLIIILVFTVLAGPITFFYLKKRNKKILLFVTTPIFSFIFCCILFITYLITEGFYKSYQGESITLINQKIKKAVVSLENEVYESMSSNYLIRDKNEIFFPIINSHQGDAYQIKVESKQMLSGKFNQSRIKNNYYQISLNDCNSNVTIQRNKEQISAKNGFATAQEIYVFDRENDQWYMSEGLILPNQTAFIIKTHDLPDKIRNNKRIQAAIISTNKQKNGFYYILYADTNEFIPFRKEEGYLQGYNQHVIIGEINE